MPAGRHIIIHLRGGWRRRRHILCRMLEYPLIAFSILTVLAIFHQQLILSGIKVSGNDIAVVLAAILRLQDASPLIGRLSPHRRIVGTIRSDAEEHTSGHLGNTHVRYMLSGLPVTAIGNACTVCTLAASHTDGVRCGGSIVSKDYPCPGPDIPAVFPCRRGSLPLASGCGGR